MLASTMRVGPMLAGLLLLLLVIANATVMEGPEMRLPLIPSLADLISEDDHPFESLGDLDNYKRTLQDHARLLISKAFSAETRRYRRALDVKSVAVTGTEQYDLGIQPPSGKVVRLVLLRTDDRTYCIFSSYRDELQTIAELSWPEHHAIQTVQFQLSAQSRDKIDVIAAYLHKNFVWMALGSSTSKLVTIACMNPENGQVALPQNIPVQVLGGLHMFQANGELYLVVGEHYREYGFETGEDSALYVLMGKYFDRVDGLRLRTKGVQSITGFADGGNYYIVFGMRGVLGSQVYQFDPMMHSMELIQQLPDTDVLQVLHYVDRHDRKHYVITVNKGASPKIYWWTREQLQEWQTLESNPVDHGYSVGIHFLDNLENIIIMSHGHEITFYTDDMSAHYFPTFTVETTCTSITNIDAIRIKEKHVIIYTCIDNRTGEVVIEGKTLIFRIIELAESQTRADSLLRCLDELDNVLHGRKEDISYLSDVISSGSLMVTDDSQTWIGPVLFSEGLTVTGTTNFADILNIKASEDPTDRQSLLDFAELANNLQYSVNSLVSDSKGVLYYSENQTISGPIAASSLIVDRAEFNYLKINNVNGIPLLDLENKFLITGVNQVINTSIVVDYMTVDLFTTRSTSSVGTINGLLTTEFMRKSVSEQIVTGEHTYESVVCGGITNTFDGSNSLTINGIDTSTIVTKDSSVTFVDRKFFNKLTILGDIDTGLVNGVDVSSLSNRLIYTDVTQQQTLAGSYMIAYILVDGNVDVASINDINLQDLNSVVVKTTGDFTLQGPVTYTKSLTITGNLYASTVNGVEWDDIVDLDSQDLISSNFYFVNAFVSESIRCDNINGLDISQDVVLVDTQQTISGRIIFKRDVLVNGESGVLMGERATINNIDVSSLLSNEAGLEVLVVKDVASFTVPLICSGDVLARTINGLVLNGIEDRYWRRSINQDINVRLHIDQGVFLDEVAALSINGHQMSDFLNFGGSQLISGSYVFKNSVTVHGNLALNADSTVNGIDVIALNSSILTIYGDQTIIGSVECTNKMTIGELDLAGRLNGIDITSDLMRLDQSLRHTGRLTFASRTTAASMALNGDLIVDSLNGFDVEASAADMVLVNEDAFIKGSFGLQFSGSLSVASLNVSGTVDGINLDSLVKHALLKSSSSYQLVTGHITVTEAVHFSQAPTLGQVNSKNWDKHLNDVVSKDYSGHISGTKTFLQPLNIYRNFDPVTINGINVADLASRCLTKSGEQVIHGHYTFSSSISTTHFSSQTIDGVNINDLLLTDHAGSLSGSVTFKKNLTFLGDVTVSTDLLGGCDVKELNTRTVERDQQGNVNIYSPLQVEYLTVIGNVISEAPVLVGTVQKVDLEHFLNTLVLRSSRQDIYGAVEFLDVSVIALYVDTINDVNIGELYRVSVMDNEDMVIECNLEFSKPITVNSLVVTSLTSRSENGVLVNGVNITNLETQIVLARGHTFIITGEKTFSLGFSTDNLTVNKTLGGVAVDDLVMVNDVRSVVQDVAFIAPITVRGDLLVSGLLDGVDLAHVLSTRVRLDKVQTVFGSCKFGAIRIKGDLEVDQINDVLVSDLIVKYGQTSQEIFGQKIFDGGLLINGNINTTLLNGLDVLQLGRTIVRRDQNITIVQPITFEGVVRTLSRVEAQGTVGDINIHDLSQTISAHTVAMNHQYDYILYLQEQITKQTSVNFGNAKNMISLLAYLEKETIYQLPYFGGLRFVGNYDLQPNANFLSITVCHKHCVCDAQTKFHKVDKNGDIGRESLLATRGSLFVLRWPSIDLQITLNVTCNVGVSTNLKFVGIRNGRLHTVLETEMSLGLVTDAGLFIDKGTAYIVTVSMFLEEPTTNSTEKTVISVLKYDDYEYSLTRVWYERSQRSATTLDLTFINNKWFLLVANQLGTENVDIYTTASRLYTWDSYGEEFVLKGNYVADHVTSGMFMKSSGPVEENLFTLTQLKVAKYPVFEENLEYTKVMVFRYCNETHTFKQFESLDTFGVVDQATLTVGNSLYLLLLSEVNEKLDVYEYYPLEGFKFYQKVPIEKPYALVVVKLESESLVVVSIRSPPGLLKLKVNVKGVNPSKLYI